MLKPSKKYDFGRLYDRCCGEIRIVERDACDERRKVMPDDRTSKVLYCRDRIVSLGEDTTYHSFHVNIVLTKVWICMSRTYKSWRRRYLRYTNIEVPWKDEPIFEHTDILLDMYDEDAIDAIVEYYHNFIPDALKMAVQDWNLEEEAAAQARAEKLP